MKRLSRLTAYTTWCGPIGSEHVEHPYMFGMYEVGHTTLEGLQDTVVI